MQRRINVDSGRPLEAKAQYSRALRVNDQVLQSGTTAIDLHGNILGQSVAEQVDAIFTIAEASMAVAEGRMKDVVRVRAFVVGQNNLQPAARAISARLDNQATSLTLIPISQLARPTQLVEIEFEAVDTAASTAVRLPSANTPAVDLLGVSIGQRLLFNGATASMGDAQQQARSILTAIVDDLQGAGASPGDIVCLRIFTSDRATATDHLSETARILDGVSPVISVIEVPAFAHPATAVMIEAEAFRAAESEAEITPHPQFADFAQSLSIDGQIYLSNIAPLDAAGTVIKPDDWGGQRDVCIEQLQSSLESIGASLDDVVNRRYFTHAAAEQNRDYGDGPAWFAATRPAALGCRVANHLHDGTVLTVEAHAVRGAGRHIDWRKLES